MSTIPLGICVYNQYQLNIVLNFARNNNIKYDTEEISKKKHWKEGNLIDLILKTKKQVKEIKKIADDLNIVALTEDEEDATAVEKLRETLEKNPPKFLSEKESDKITEQILDGTFLKKHA